MITYAPNSFMITKELIQLKFYKNHEHPRRNTDDRVEESADVSALCNSLHSNCVCHFTVLSERG